MSKYDNSICYQNIMYLYKTKGLKIGEFESKIGASTGHFSRLVKDNGKIGAISSDLLFSAADLFEIPVEILGSVDLREMNPTESYIYSFLLKLLNDTKNEIIDWTRKKITDLEQAKYFSNLIYHNDYHSAFWDNDSDEVYLNGDVLYFYQKSGYFVLTNVIVTKNGFKFFDGYELYFIKFSDSLINNVCYSFPNQKECINNLLDLLYESVINYFKAPKINDAIKNAIDAFMSEKKD